MRALVCIALFATLGCQRKQITDAPRAESFQSARQLHPTKLVVHGPAPQKYGPWPADGPYRTVVYRSGALQLRALFAPPANDRLRRSGKSPVLVYLHGGFALGVDDVDDCAAAREAGFAVFAPSLRGENGNPGDYEAGFGELDDARAAIAHASELDSVDGTRVIVFGHSAGGMLSAMTSLYAEPAVLDTGSAGGIYDERVFDHLSRPFADSATERRLRLFEPFAKEMVKSHFACVGRKDVYPLGLAERIRDLAAIQKLPFTLRVVEGDHFSSLAPCLDAFVTHVLPKVQ